ncbi:SGNH/GDSL hydrolase family protein [Kineosporia sp. J2-2]|uniref:SGNH/GDSL hydrolase family protein n=1 Tax=Kineosporia corallincola TaxID=2835133 RepID=A0ABS5TL19_9ACTN|nr:SGNH/GDSL hydrolase family protein [Kineosporia corallincola]
MPSLRRRAIIISALASLTIAGAVLYGVQTRASARRSAERTCHQAELAAHDQALRNSATEKSPGEYLLVFGDSYAAGQYQEDHQQTWPYVTGSRLGVLVDVYGRPGAGFVSRGCLGKPFTEDPPLTGSGPVVVQGGLNDERSNPTEVEAAARLVLASWPAHDVFLVGPPIVPARGPGEARKIDSALRSAAQAVGAHYVSALDWIPTNEFLPDGLHLTARGHMIFGQRVAAAVSNIREQEGPTVLNPRPRSLPPNR